MITLKNILDLLQYTEENVALYDSNDNLLFYALFVDVRFVPFYNCRVNSIESLSYYGIRITINVKKSNIEDMSR